MDISNFVNASYFTYVTNPYTALLCTSDFANGQKRKRGSAVQKNLIKDSWV